jgi:hypothetical protein
VFTVENSRQFKTDEVASVVLKRLRNKEAAVS